VARTKFAVLAALSAALMACSAANEPAPAGDATGAAPKGYVVAEIRVTDPEPYKEYLAAVTPLVEKFGGTYLVRAGESETREGAAPEGRIVVLEYPSYAAAKAFYDSPEYQAILPLRTNNAVSRIIIIEGFAP
jgi:uncharacterized protein (DUF1330 family)